MGTVGGEVATKPAAAVTTASGGSPRAIDIHAHFFPEGFLDILAIEGKRYNLEYQKQSGGFTLGTVGCGGTMTRGARGGRPATEAQGASGA